MSKSMASAVALPEEDSVEIATNGVKRRHSEHGSADVDTIDSKRRRTSGKGKDSPVAMPAEQDIAQIKQEPEPTPTQSESPAPKLPAQKAEDTRESRRKSAVGDEKQRSKRLFGALLVSQNQPSDRVSKRRGEIEQRKKAELQKQFDERLEDRQRRLEKLAIQRKREQIRVDEDNMCARHKQLLNVANFLQTKAEPKLYYRPWDLLPDEEDRIDDQIKDAQTQIDKELAEWEQEKQKRLGALDERSETSATNEAATEDSPQKTEDAAASVLGEGKDEADEKANLDDANKADKTERPADIPESETNSPDGPENKPSEAGAEHETNGATATHEAKVTLDEAKDDVDDEVEGDEDNVIY